ncbi:hypothetical protein [Pseudomonas sp. NFACC02]|nr:hypothetical protein [Pseudomonas sp. NFACC02]
MCATARLTPALGVVFGLGQFSHYSLAPVLLVVLVLIGVVADQMIIR